MLTLILLFLAMAAAFAAEELWLFKPVWTINQSDPLARRLVLAAIWMPVAGMVANLTTIGVFGGYRLTGLGNVLGFVLCAAGLGLRIWSRRALGRFFTIGIVTQPGHLVIREGPYQVVRHPAYLGLILFYAGLPLLIGSFWGLVFLSAPAALVFTALVVVEERHMVAKLGAAYRDYQRDSARLIPGVW